ncbi:peptidoglycan-binding protein LysM [Spirochaetia bacterium]|nr:peptidoglycan-binding protein LysM [Spirochaetia bacterium]
MVDALAFAAPATADETIHVIRKGDTIYSLAGNYGVSQQEILNLNGISDPNRIFIGQRIRIPGTMTAVSESFLDHRVTKNETLWGIARQYGIPRKALCQANNISEDYKVKLGELLRIPQSGLAVTALPPPDLRPPQRDTVPVTRIPAPPPAAETIPTYEVRSTKSRTLDQSVAWPILAREMAYMTGKLNGVVLTGERNEPVKSLKEGVVISAGPYRGFGKVAIIQVSGGYLYVYGGCESLSVREGDRVTTGAELGRLGMDALSEKPQLFFLVYRNSMSMDPALAPRS